MSHLLSFSLLLKRARLWSGGSTGNLRKAAMAAMSGWFGKLSVLGLTDNVQSGILRVGLQAASAAPDIVTFLSVLALLFLKT